MEKPIATITEDDNCLRICRSNAPYYVDIKAGAALWCGTMIFFGSVLVAGNLLDHWMHRMGEPPLFDFVPLDLFLLMELLCAFAILVNLIPALIGLRSPRSFVLDRGRNRLSVGGQEVGYLASASVHLEYSFGWTRRAFRLVLSHLGTSYVIAHTQKQTFGILTGKEYTSDVLNHDFHERRWFNTWIPYAGETTGFNADWPEYREIFGLYETVLRFLPTKSGAADDAKPPTDRTRDTV